jgi:hypothetical protein
MKLFIQQLMKRYENIFYRYPKANLDIRRMPPKKVSIFLYSTHGDIVWASSLTQFIKSKYRNCRLTFITSRKCQYTTSLNPDVDKIITVDFPHYWSYGNVEKIKKKLDYDIFVNASFYPNLRYLIPFMPLIEVPFFLFRNKPDKLPTPRLKLNFGPEKGNYFLLNLEAGTFAWHKNMVDHKQIIFMENQIIENHPKVNFVVNQCYEQKNVAGEANVSVFEGDMKGLLKMAAGSLGVISLRNGLCDILASSTEVPQLAIYPEGNFPDDDGISAIKWGTMTGLGYKAPITESVVNRKRFSSIKDNLDKINKFIKTYSK